jgi:hypothetical protein
MTLPTNDILPRHDDLANRELSVEELEAIAAGSPWTWRGLGAAITAGGVGGGLGGAAVGGIGAVPGAIGGGCIGGITYLLTHFLD